jgi:hypothetical protein
MRRCPCDSRTRRGDEKRRGDEHTDWCNHGHRWVHRKAADCLVSAPHNVDLDQQSKQYEIYMQS